MADTSSATSSVIDWAKLIYGIYKDQNPKQGKFVVPPTSPWQDKIFGKYYDWMSGGSPTGAMLTPAIIENLKANNPTFQLPNLIGDEAGHNVLPNSGKIGGANVDWDAALARFNTALTPPPLPKTPGGGSSPDPGMKDPNGGGSRGSGSPVPGGGDEPFPPGWMGPAGEGGPDSPDIKTLLGIVAKGGADALLGYFGGPLGTLAKYLYNMFKGGGSSTPPPPGSIGTPDTQNTLMSGGSNWHPPTERDLGLNASEGTFGDIFQHPTDATGAGSTFNFWDNLMNAPGQVSPDYFSFRTNPNIGAKR